MVEGRVWQGPRRGGCPGETWEVRVWGGEGASWLAGWSCVAGWGEYAACTQTPPPQPQALGPPPSKHDLPCRGCLLGWPGRSTW